MIPPTGHGKVEGNEPSWDGNLDLLCNVHVWWWLSGWLTENHAEAGCCFHLHSLWVIFEQSFEQHTITYCSIGCCYGAQTGVMKNIYFCYGRYALCISIRSVFWRNEPQVIHLRQRDVIQMQIGIQTPVNTECLLKKIMWNKTWKQRNRTFMCCRQAEW